MLVLMGKGWEACLNCLRYPKYPESFPLYCTTHWCVFVVEGWDYE